MESRPRPRRASAANLFSVYRNSSLLNRSMLSLFQLAASPKNPEDDGMDKRSGQDSRRRLEKVDRKRADLGSRGAHGSVSLDQIREKYEKDSRGHRATATFSSEREVKDNHGEERRATRSAKHHHSQDQSSKTSVKVRLRRKEPNYDRNLRIKPRKIDVFSDAFAQDPRPAPRTPLQMAEAAAASRVAQRFAPLPPLPSISPTEPIRMPSFDESVEWAELEDTARGPDARTEQLWFARAPEETRVGSRLAAAETAEHDIYAVHNTSNASVDAPTAALTIAPRAGGAAPAYVPAADSPVPWATSMSSRTAASAVESFLDSYLDENGNEHGHEHSPNTAELEHSFGRESVEEHEEQQPYSYAELVDAVSKFHAANRSTDTITVVAVPVDNYEAVGGSAPPPHEGQPIDQLSADQAAGTSTVSSVAGRAAVQKRNSSSRISIRSSIRCDTTADLGLKVKLEEGERVGAAAAATVVDFAARPQMQQRATPAPAAEAEQSNERAPSSGPTAQLPIAAAPAATFAVAAIATPISSTTGPSSGVGGAAFASAVARTEQQHPPPLESEQQQQGHHHQQNHRHLQQPCRPPRSYSTSSASDLSEIPPSGSQVQQVDRLQVDISSTSATQDENKEQVDPSCRAKVANDSRRDSDIEVNADSDDIAIDDSLNTKPLIRTTNNSPTIMPINEADRFPSRPPTMLLPPLPAPSLPSNGSRVYRAKTALPPTPEEIESSIYSRRNDSKRRRMAATRESRASERRAGKLPITNRFAVPATNAGRPRTAKTARQCDHEQQRSIVARPRSLLHSSSASEASSSSLASLSQRTRRVPTIVPVAKAVKTTTINSQRSSPHVYLQRPIRYSTFAAPMVPMVRNDSATAFPDSDDDNESDDDCTLLARHPSVRSGGVERDSVVCDDICEYFEGFGFESVSYGGDAFPPPPPPPRGPPPPIPTTRARSETMETEGNIAGVADVTLFSVSPFLPIAEPAGMWSVLASSRPVATAPTEARSSQSSERSTPVPPPSPPRSVVTPSPPPLQPRDKPSGKAFVRKIASKDVIAQTILTTATKQFTYPRTPAASTAQPYTARPPSSKDSHSRSSSDSQDSTGHASTTSTVSLSPFGPATPPDVHAYPHHLGAVTSAALHAAPPKISFTATSPTTADPPGVEFDASRIESFILGAQAASEHVAMRGHRYLEQQQHRRQRSHLDLPSSSHGYSYSHPTFGSLTTLRAVSSASLHRDYRIAEEEDEESLSSSFDGYTSHTRSHTHDDSFDFDWDAAFAIRRSRSGAELRSSPSSRGRPSTESTSVWPWTSRWLAPHHTAHIGPAAASHLQRLRELERQQQRQTQHSRQQSLGRKNPLGKIRRLMTGAATTV